METPDHYNKQVSPWDLQRSMESSGSPFIDARRADAIKYTFRKKDDQIKDLKKAIHCLQAAVKELESSSN